MINKIAGAMAIIGVLMIVFMVAYIDLYGLWERLSIAIGAIIFIAPWVSLKFVEMAQEMNGDYFDDV